MPKSSILNIPGIVISKEEYRPGTGAIFLGRQKRDQIVCYRCNLGDKLRKKSCIRRFVRHVNIGDTPIYVHWEGHKYYCKRCERYFNERFPGVRSRRRYSEAFRKDIVNQHAKGISQSELSRWRRCGAATIERWYHELMVLKTKEYESYRYPRYLGIDEHFFSRRQGYSTTLCDLGRNRIHDILLGKSRKAIWGDLISIPGREQVEMVNMDLCDHYRRMAEELFPNAVIVADRFHVIRLINYAFLKTVQGLVPEQKNKANSLSLWRKHEWNLSKAQQKYKVQYFKEFPHLLPIYEFKQKLNLLLSQKHRTQRQCRRLIPQLMGYLEELKSQHFLPLKTLAKTLEKWKEPIAAMWRFTKTNSITEGFHRKMKLIQRRAYGFKNFENYRLRVKALCASREFTLL